MEKGQKTYTELYGMPQPRHDAVSAASKFAGMLKDAGAMWEAHTDSPEERPLIEMTEQLAKRMQTSPPKQIIIYQSFKPNAAMVLGGTMLVSTNLLEVMNPKEIKSIVAHELSHKLRIGFRTPILIAVSLLGSMLYNHTFGRNLHRKMIEKLPGKLSYNLASSAVSMLESMGVLAAVTYFSRKEEYQADKESARTTGEPEYMISALAKLEGRSAELMGRVQAIKPEELSPEEQEKLKDMPKKNAVPVQNYHNTGLRKMMSNAIELFQTHPRTEKRIAALKEQKQRMSHTQKLDVTKEQSTLSSSQQL